LQSNVVLYDGWQIKLATARMNASDPRTDNGDHGTLFSLNHLNTNSSAMAMPTWYCSIFVTSVVCRCCVVQTTWQIDLCLCVRGCYACWRHCDVTVVQQQRVLWICDLLDCDSITKWMSALMS